jgi:hypothetical protein
MTLKEIILERARLRREMQDKEELFKAEQQAREYRLEEVDDLYNLAVEHDVDLGKLAIAKEHIFVQGVVDLGGGPQTEERMKKRQQVVRDAIDEIAKGGGRLHTYIFATQNNQNVDERLDIAADHSRTYGGITFAISLYRLAPGRTLNQDQIEAILYTLTLMLGEPPTKVESVLRPDSVLLEE